MSKCDDVPMVLAHSSDMQYLDEMIDELGLKLLKIAVTIPSHIDLECFSLKLLIGTWSWRVIARLFRTSELAGTAHQPGGIHGRDCQRGVPSQDIGEPGWRRYMIGIIWIIRYTGTRKKSEVLHWYFGYLESTAALVGGTVDGGLEIGACT